MLKNEIESYVRIGGMFEKSYIRLHGVGGVKNCQNHPYVINEWPLIYLIWKFLATLSTMYRIFTV